ncbi:hypothetical protein CU102_20515 [Phyllobacterium brassicacearum]|uniref:Uncharacterized protein n=1 Tax=Phyllobacterium brassicacearum TaxID=314235 RepID=A0A2P7BGJ6_9HYPH|nr:hypothetical protein CU102_20515 [Phyllobacterium brassicacearum]
MEDSRKQGHVTDRYVPLSLNFSFPKHDSFVKSGIRYFPPIFDGPQRAGADLNLTTGLLYTLINEF